MALHEEVRNLVQAILDQRLSEYRHNCSVNITDLVFLEIEKDDNIIITNRDLESSYSTLSGNQNIGRFVKVQWDLDNIGREYNPESSLIDSYMKHSN